MSMTLCFVVPAYNEGRTIGKLIRRLRLRFASEEILVVNDGSRDDTTAEAKAAGASVIELPVNLGYGSALHTGLIWAYRQGAEIVVTLDADGQHDPAEVEKLLPPVMQNRADLSLGSRYLPESICYPVPILRRWGARFFAILISFLTGTRITDPTTGFQCMNRRVLESYIHLRDFPERCPDADLLLYAHYCGFRIAETPVAMYEDEGQDSMHGGLRSLFYVPEMLVAMAGILSAQIHWRRRSPA